MTAKHGVEAVSQNIVLERWVSYCFLNAPINTVLLKHGFDHNTIMLLIQFFYHVFF